MLRDPKAEARIARELEGNKLTAEQLGVKPEFLRAFDRVLEMFKRGEVKHVPYRKIGSQYDDRPKFNMATWACGSVHCIGGFCQREMGVSRFKCGWEAIFLADDAKDGHRIQLLKLFFPIDDDLGHHTVKEAIAAMESWRSTGVTKWP